MICDKKDCTGCFACYNICPKNAITMQEDEYGYIYPIINDEKCIKCNLCKKICPSITKLEFHQPDVCYAVYSNDNKIRSKSTSGGVATVLSKNIITSYSGAFKQSVIEYMHTNHLSLQETAYHFNLANHSIIGKWERIYYEEGPQALYEERRGRSKYMNSKPRKKKLSKEVEEDLIAENQRLRMENEYLKKLNALVQERIKRENKKK